MDVVEWVKSALILTVGAFLIWFVTNSFTKSFPEYGVYGWGIVAAYVAGVAFYLKHGLGSSND